METLKFGYKLFKKSMPLAIFAEILSFLGIYAELLLPLLSGMLIDFVIQSGEVKKDSGGMFHFLLTGRFGEVHTMELFFAIAVVYTIMLMLRVVLIYIRDLIQEWVGLKLETELLIKEALDVFIKDKTAFIVAHRLSTIRNSDRILYISNKGIAEEGTHEELMAKKGLYYELAR